ncbi:hypothetical protein ACO0K9_12230 [Undibacterium sp. Ji50W]|uniref:hypothetical protein n=1 Tax=Undibacterium sp. Ji50W TaxID=3413041 RepID=UPI003BF1C70C
MLQIAAAILSIINFLAQNKDQVKQLITSIESLIPDAPGNQKALQVRNFISASLGIEDQFEKAWDLVAPLFNSLVAATKTGK